MSQADLKQLAKALGQGFASCTLHEALGELTLVIPMAEWSTVSKRLRDEAGFQFDQLIDLCGVDYSTYGQSEWDTTDVTHAGFSRAVEASGGDQAEHPSRFAVVCHLLSTTLNQRLRLKVYCGDEAPVLSSLYPVWNVADWFEREAFDLFGIQFEGHPDLRRILTDYGFKGHPLCKDFPLSGHVEMRYDAKTGRCVYEPVDIQPRVGVPRVIRSKERGAK